MTEIPKHFRQALITDTNSRINKIWIAIDLQHRGYFIKWKWSSTPFNSRLLFLLDTSGKYLEAKSYDDDVKPFLIENRPKKWTVEDLYPI
jgi:hypothetical protein